MRVEISVIIPTYNRYQTLRKTIESLLNQDLEKDKYEIIVVDDGSTDETKWEIQSYPIKYIRQEHQGPAIARNTGVKIATGKLLAFIDSDAIADKEWLKKALSHFQSPSLTILEGKIINPSSEPLSLFAHTFENLKGGLYQTCNIFIRREVFVAVNGFDPAFGKDYFFREDSDLIFTLMEKGLFRGIFAEDVIVYHPPRISSPKMLIDQAKRYQWDPLLYKKHPKLYRKFLGSPFDGHQLTILFSILGIIIFLFLKKISAVCFFLLVTFLSYTIEILKGIKGKKFTAPELMIFIGLMFLVPLVKSAYIIKGNIKFKVLLW